MPKMNTNEMHALKTIWNACHLNEINESQKINTLFKTLGFRNNHEDLPNGNFSIMFDREDFPAKITFTFDNRGILIDAETAKA